MASVKHVHTYVQYKKRPGFFRCAAPDCTHSIDKESLVGKLSNCNKCGSTFVLSADDLRRVKPKCLNCSNTKKAKKARKVQELTRYIGTEAFGSVLEKGLNKSEELDFYDKPTIFTSEDLSDDPLDESEELA